MVMNELKRAISVFTFCQRYGIGRTKTYDEIKAGRLRTVKAGHRTLIRADDAEAWLQSLPNAKKRRRPSDPDSNPSDPLV
jgi:excisionase family DNA binding protein